MSIYDNIEDGVKKMEKKIIAGAVTCALIAASTWVMPSL